MPGSLRSKLRTSTKLLLPCMNSQTKSQPSSKSSGSTVCLTHSGTSLRYYKARDIGRGKALGPTGAFRKLKKLTLRYNFKSLIIKTSSHPIHLGAINVTYTTVPGMLSLKNQTEGNLAQPDVDFVSVVGFLILEEGETAAAINITILEVKLFSSCYIKSE